MNNVIKDAAGGPLSLSLSDQSAEYCSVFSACVWNIINLHSQCFLAWKVGVGVGTHATVSTGLREPKLMPVELHCGTRKVEKEVWRSKTHSAFLISSRLSYYSLSQLYRHFFFLALTSILPNQQIKEKKKKWTHSKKPQIQTVSWNWKSIADSVTQQIYVALKGQATVEFYVAARNYLDLWLLTYSRSAVQQTQGEKKKIMIQNVFWASTEESLNIAVISQILPWDVLFRPIWVHWVL